MRMKNDRTLFQWLIEGGYPSLAPSAHFDFDDDIFAGALEEVRLQHPELSEQEAQARAAYRLLTKPPIHQVKPPTILQKALKNPWPILKFVWAILVLLLLSVIAAHGQNRPDCQVQFELTAAGRSASFDNRNSACTTWTLTYYSTGFSAVSIQFDFAQDSSGVPGSWSVWGTAPTALASGTTLPLTATTSGQATGFRYVPWVSVNLSSVTGSGTVRGTLLGWRPGSQQDASATGGGTTVSQGSPPWTVDLTRVGGTALTGANVVDGANTAFRVNCVTGCAGSSFADNSAFTFGTTTIANMGAVVDDTATNTVTENSAGAPRMNTNRILYHMNTNSTGTEVGTAGSPFNVVFPSAQAVTQSGTWTVQPGNTANTTPWLFSINQGGNTATVTAGGRLSVDGSGVTQPVSGTVTANQGGAPWTFTGTKSHNAVVPGATNLGTLPCLANAAAPTYTETFQVSLSCDLSGSIRVTGTFFQATQPVSITAGNFPDNEPFNVAQINGQTPLMGNGVTGTGSQRVTIASDNTAFTVNIGTFPDNEPVNATLSAETTKVIGTVRVQGNVGGAFDAADGAAPPANRIAVGGLTSGATGGLMESLTICDSYANVNIVTATTTLIITGVAGRHVRICAFSLVTAGANNVALISGTGATCGTGTTGMTGGTTAATGYNFAANGGISQGTGSGEINRTNATGDSVCIVTSAAVQLSGRIAYAIY